MSRYEVVVVGAGQNSLSAAAYLAAAGLKVLVLDKNPVAGGGAVSRELTAPGFIHDTHAGQMVLKPLQERLAHEFPNASLTLGSAEPAIALGLLALDDLTHHRRNHAD